MVIPTTRADVFIWCLIAVLLVLDWYIGGMVYNRPSVIKNTNEQTKRSEENEREVRAA
jgi:hypothetical protein